MSSKRSGVLTSYALPLEQRHAGTQQDLLADSVTDNAIRYIFFPTADSVKAVFLKSEGIGLYEADTATCEKCDLLMFSNGFIFCRKSVEGIQKKRGLLKRLGSLFEYDECSHSEQSKFGRIESAFLLSDIDRVETLKFWNTRDIKMHLRGNDEVAASGCAFAIFTRNERTPIIVCCATKKDVESWIDTFRVCISGQKSKVLGRNRQTINKDGVVFGINNRRWTRHTTSLRQFGDSIQWDDDGF